MANRFGMFYNEADGKAYTTDNFTEEYIPMSHRNPKTPVHARCYEEDRERAALKRKKDSEKKEKESKKKWVEKGCGHSSMFNFVSHHYQPPNPVTNEKEVQTQHSASSDVSSANNSDYEGDRPVKTENSESGMGYSLSQIARGEYNSPACSTKSSESSSSSVEVVKTVLPFELKNEDTVEVDVDVEDEEDGEDEYDPDDINVQDIEPEENSQTEQGGVDEADDFVCVGCGNDRENCHQYLFGGWLVQDAICILDEKSPDEITEEDVINRMKDKYNTQLSFGCWHKIKMFDTACCYDFPGCLRESSVEYALKVIKNQQIFFHLKQRRQGGIAIKTLRNTSWSTNSDDK